VIAACVTAIKPDSTAISVCTYAVISIAAAEPIAAVEAAAVVAVIPGAGADKDTTDEPVRTIKSVRGARVGIIGVVAIGTNWCSHGIVIAVSVVIPISRAYTHSNCYLGICAQHRRRTQEQAEKQTIT
jgi:hypothetical protein